MTDLDALITSARTSTHTAQPVDIAIVSGRIVAVTLRGSRRLLLSRSLRIRRAMAIEPASTAATNRRDGSGL
jgi:hypothetical protein